MKTTPIKALYNRNTAIITGKFDCPFCGAHGPHDDNGMTGEQQTFCCYTCSNNIDADMVEAPAH